MEDSYEAIQQLYQSGCFKRVGSAVMGTPSRVVPCRPVPGGMHMADATFF